MCPVGLISFTLNTYFLNILVVFVFFPVTLRLESCPIIYRSSGLSAILRCGIGRYEGERSEAGSKSGNSYLPLCILAWAAGWEAGRSRWACKGFDTCMVRRVQSSDAGPWKPLELLLSSDLPGVSASVVVFGAMFKFDS